MLISTPVRPQRLRGLRDAQSFSPSAFSPVVPPWRRYREQVIRRHSAGAYTILLREEPMSGLRGLGSGTTSAITTAAGIGTKAGLAAAGIGGLAAAGITAGAGVLIAVFASLWSAHEARAKGARSENQALNSAVSTFLQTVQATFQAANQGQITGATAAQMVQSNYQTFWSQMCPFTQGPGRADASGCGANCGGPVNMSAPCAGLPNGHFCNKSCTATCCVGCQDLLPITQQAVGVFNSPTGGTIQVCTVSASKYGLVAAGGGTLTYTPPAPGSVAGVANALSSGSTIAGIPLWMLLAGGVGAYLAFR